MIKLHLMRRYIIALSAATCMSTAVKAQHAIEINAGLNYYDTDEAPRDYPYFNTQGLASGIQYSYTFKNKWQTGLDLTYGYRNLDLASGEQAFNRKANVFLITPFVGDNFLKPGSKSELPFRINAGVATAREKVTANEATAIFENYTIFTLGGVLSYYYRIADHLKIGIGTRVNWLSVKRYIDDVYLYQNKLKIAYTF